MLLNALTLTPLFWALTLATITLEDLPHELRAGSEVHIKWNQDRDYVSASNILAHKPSSPRTQC